MTLTTEELQELQEEYMADDVELTEAMCAWTAAEARVYFEHMLEPPPPEEKKKWLPRWKEPQS